MKRFRCNQCQSLVVFKNDHCVNCGSRLAYVPELGEMVTWSGPDALETATLALGPGQTIYRLCRNYIEHGICNWAVAAHDDSDLCLSCRLTKVIPDLTVSGNLTRWYWMEAAKRRVMVGLIGLSLPLDTAGDPEAQPLSFEFKADEVTPLETRPVLTGHSNGVVTINIAEADDAERERRRVTMHEPYRTLVGHFRHEVGHYYWDRLIGSSRRLRTFRDVFGDERADYAASLAAHYQNGPAADWQQHFISAYSSAHPWEDWAETWAHYLHMVDSLETAEEGGLSLRPKRTSDPSFTPGPGIGAGRSRSFSSLFDRWRSLAYVLNELNRALGLRDAYPFVISNAVIAKLEFVHKVLEQHRRLSRIR